MFHVSTVWDNKLIEKKIIITGKIFAPLENYTEFLISVVLGTAAWR